MIADKAGWWFLAEAHPIEKLLYFRNVHIEPEQVGKEFGQHVIHAVSIPDEFVSAENSDSGALFFRDEMEKATKAFNENQS